MNKSLEIKTALRNQFKEGTSRMAKRVCYGYSQDENKINIHHNNGGFSYILNAYKYGIVRGHIGEIV